MKRVIQCTAGVLLATTILANLSLVLTPGVARAGALPAFGIPPFAAGASVPVMDFVAETNTFEKILNDSFEWLMRFIRETLRKQLLNMIVQQIIQWIQGGGTPKFITDWGGFLGDAAQTAVGQFANEIGLGFLCQPFSLQLRVALGIGVPGSGGGFSKQISCTLDSIVGNINNFYNNFENGGWLAYQTMLEPQNNFYGAYLMAVERKTSLVESRVSNAALEGVAGGGFLGTKKCQQYASGHPLAGQDIPGSCKITTPGQTIGALAAKAVGSDIDYIINAEELEAFVAAIADALINRLIGLGIEGLAGVFTSAESGPGYNPPISGSGCAGLTGEAALACEEYLNPSIATSTSALAPPQNIAAVPANTNKVTVMWTERATGETGYIVERSSGGPSSYSTVATLGPDTYLFIDTGLVPAGASFYYRVKATDGTITSTSNADSATTILSQSGSPLDDPPDPTNVTARPGNTSTIVVAWTDNAAAETEYRIRYAPYLNTNCSASGATTDVLPPNTTHFELSSLSPGTVRYFCVQSRTNPPGPVGFLGSSDWVGPVSALTPAF